MEFNFNALFLLVGTNPLPNLVVADYFLKNISGLSQIFLLYSEKTAVQSGTKDYADLLKETIKNRKYNNYPEFHFICLSDVALPSQIRTDLNKTLKNYQLDKLHLNYTGGTKAMGISVYQTLKELYGSKVSFSYLDARTFKIVSDESNRITNDLRREIKINIDELISLHGFERDKSGLVEADFFDALRYFKKLIDTNNLSSYFNSYNREVFLDKENLINRKKSISDVLRNHKASGEFLSVVTAMPEEYRLFDQNGRFIEPQTDKQLGTAVKFLDGVWLEHYVYKVLKEHFGNQYCMEKNLVIKKAGWKNRNFELDVVMINGYQLVGISCTTSQTMHICKSKGFEIFMRTRQIGGEEAKAVLVTRLNNNKNNEDDAKLLERELKIDTGSIENLIVLSQKDLKSEILIERIAQLIE